MQICQVIGFANILHSTAALVLVKSKDSGIFPDFYRIENHVGHLHENGGEHDPIWLRSSEDEDDAFFVFFAIMYAAVCLLLCSVVVNFASFLRMKKNKTPFFGQKNLEIFSKIKNYQQKHPFLDKN